VGTPDAASISKVTLIALSSVTHGFNMGQRISRPLFSQATGGLNVTAPSNPNNIPPGYYMLFILNSNGVPSVAKIVQIGGTNPAPTPSPTPTSTPNPTQSPTPTPTPAAPTNLTATAVSSSQINLSWSDNSNNQTGFVINRTQNPSIKWNYVTTVGANATSYSDSPLFASTTYYYRVQAINNERGSAWSNTASANTGQQPTPTPTPTPTPAAPTNLAATAVSSSQINLSWTDHSNNETGFKMYRARLGRSFRQIATLRANVTTYADIGRRRSTTYRYRVRAYNAGGNSAYSNIASATTNP
jgi:hypothetical protein